MNCTIRFMRRLLFTLTCCLAFAACSDKIVDDNDNQGEFLPETEIFVQGQLLTPQTKAAYKWPYNNAEEGWESARFTIRADGKIQDFTNKNAGDYYGRSGNVSGNNRGKLSSLYPYGHYNDRDLDYYKKDKKTGENIGWFRYVYDPNGLKTQLAIIEAPSVVDILTDVKEDLTKEIDAGKNVNKNTKKLDQINGWLEKGAEYLDSHVLWYVAKEVGMQYGWHVNGVITDEEVPDYRLDPNQKIPDNVEIDIHQQDHYDWNEIKTSIHIRTDCESLSLNLPLDYESIVEQDKFEMKVFDYNYKDYVISHEILHNEDGITIRISGIPAELINELKSQFGDGLTIEIHSYCTSSDYWDQLKESCVLKTGKPCSVIGQITSAFNDELIPIKVMNP